MLHEAEKRKEILAQRDAMVLSLQYGLCARNQEVWGLRWSSLQGEFAWVLEVPSNGRLDEWGKTAHSTQRRTAVPTILQEDLTMWRQTLSAAGHPTRALDFIIPGDLAGREHGTPDPRSGACRFSESQARAWDQRFFTPAVEKAAEQPEMFAISRRDPLLAAPRRHLPAPTRRGSTNRRQRAAPACGCSPTTTPTRPRTSAAMAHVQLTQSGAPHAPNSNPRRARDPIPRRRSQQWCPPSRQDSRVARGPQARSVDGLAVLRLHHSLRSGTGEGGQTPERQPQGSRSSTLSAMSWKSLRL